MLPILADDTEECPVGYCVSMPCWGIAVLWKSRARLARVSTMAVHSQGVILCVGDLFFSRTDRHLKY
jgi:hypothetical protein